MQIHWYSTCSTLFVPFLDFRGHTFLTINTYCLPAPGQLLLMPSVMKKAYGQGVRVENSYPAGKLPESGTPLLKTLYDELEWDKTTGAQIQAQRFEHDYFIGKTGQWAKDQITAGKIHPLSLPSMMMPPV